VLGTQELCPCHVQPFLAYTEAFQEHRLTDPCRSVLSEERIVQFYKFLEPALGERIQYPAFPSTGSEFLLVSSPVPRHALCSRYIIARYSSRLSNACSVDLWQVYVAASSLLVIALALFLFMSASEAKTHRAFRANLAHMLVATYAVVFSSAIFAGGKRCALSFAFSPPPPLHLPREAPAHSHGARRPCRCRFHSPATMPAQFFDSVAGAVAARTRRGDFDFLMAALNAVVCPRPHNPHRNTNPTRAPHGGARTGGRGARAATGAGGA
jgi:hypothetical protein